jgi:hypothetical protein
VIFRDRVDAGERLAAALQRYRDQESTVVLGIPRGGVVVAEAIAVDLHLPLSVPSTMMPFSSSIGGSASTSGSPRTTLRRRRLASGRSCEPGWRYWARGRSRRSRAEP